MKTTLILLGVVALASPSYGLTCRFCDDLDFDGEASRKGNCFTNTSAGFSTTCLPDGDGFVYYCRARLISQDGVITRVTRDCQRSDFDEDQFTTEIPSGTKCITAFSSAPDVAVITNCYYHCDQDDCNSSPEPLLNVCSTDCNFFSGGGSCDYIMGTCVCNAGFSGTNCQTKETVTPPSALRKCLQCNSLTGSCGSGVAATDCPSSQSYCSTANTTILDSSHKAVASVITRGCSSNFVAADECSFTNIYSDTPIRFVGYTEFTCFSTCSTDGCNTNNADGRVNDNEEVTLQCVQCSGSSSCANETSRSPCPSSTTHCKSTVSYLISNRQDLSHNETDPAYRLLSVTRECATEESPIACISNPVEDLNMERVTCTETCTTDGCNTGWPARPRCILCDTRSGYEACLENPPDLQECPFPYQEYCTIQETGVEKGSLRPLTGYTHRLIRSCSHKDIGNRCSSIRPRDTDIESCNRSCTTDGCNQGNGGELPALSMHIVIASVVLALLCQNT